MIMMPLPGIYLDVLQQIASLPIDYNHPAVLSAMTDPDNLPMLAQRPCLGLLPPNDWTRRIHKKLMRIAPMGLAETKTVMCCSCSNESAFKAKRRLPMDVVAMFQ